ncbi:MAG: fructosamine kinase family protein [Campylobacterales bacterium]
MKRTPLGSNSVATVWLEEDTAGPKTVVKESRDAFALVTEARMLNYLAPYLRVPEVLALEKGRLVMEYIPNDPRCDGSCEEEIADVLAALHGNTSERFGLEFDTTIGPFRQKNTPASSWIEFYREQRVLDFAAKAFNEGRIDKRLLSRIEKFAADFERFLSEPEQPSLLHGDVWGGNVLTRNNRLAALIDPAIYYGHFEMELAFIGMFHTFGERFYARYREHRPIEPDFFETRADLYRLFPYLVHVRAFGGGYLGGLETILRRTGY